MSKSKNTLLTLLLTTALLSTACEDILNKEPTDKLSLEETFKDMDGVRTALAGSYAALGTIELYHRNITVYPDLVGGNISYAPVNGRDLEDLYSFAQTATESDMSSTYADLYSALANVNNIIKYTPQALYGTPEEKNQVMAEAKALRALLHFDLVRLFARPYAFSPDASHPGIVLMLQPRTVEASQAKRATVAEVYQSITSDLEEAVQLHTGSLALDATKAQYYLSLQATQALLAKVYLYRQNWQKAFDLASAVLSNGKYKLIPREQYVASWAAKTPSAESIFELALPQSFAGTSPATYYATNSSDVQYAASTDLLQLYTDTDIRGRVSMFNSRSWSGTEYLFTKKYAELASATTPVKVLRLSELYLIRAEAAAELGNLDQANQDLSAIVLRADSAATATAYTSNEAAVEAILLERRKELAFEGNLFFDLMRRGQDVQRYDCAATSCSLPYTDTRLVLPIPQQTIIVNPLMEQNPGY